MLLPSKASPALLDRFPDYLRNQRPIQVTRLGTGCNLESRIADEQEIKRLMSVFSTAEFAVIVARHGQPMACAYIVEFAATQIARVAEMLCDTPKDLPRAVESLFAVSDIFWKWPVTRVILPSLFWPESHGLSATLENGEYAIELER